MLVGSPWLLPVFNTAPAYPFMVAALARGDTGRAIRLMWVWALALASGGTALSLLLPDTAARLVLNGEPYWQQMHTWLATGQGAESEPARFVPQHVLHLTAFSTLTIATGGVLGMPLGAVLMNFMDYYVAQIVRAAGSPAAAAVVAWHPWALIRVASFVIIGVVLSGPLLARVRGFPFRLTAQRRWLAIAGAGLLLDVTLKWLLADSWRELLLRLTVAHP